MIFLDGIEMLANFIECLYTSMHAIPHNPTTYTITRNVNSRRRRGTVHAT